jgi:hypothetical protein
LNEFGSGQPDVVAGAAKRRPLRPQGNSRACILRRLRRDYPALHQQVLDGQISPHRAAIQAGFRRAPGKRLKRRPFDEFELSATQMQELWLGAGHQGSAFSSEDERHAAWIRHRDRLMQHWGCHGRRPLAWWCFEAPADLDYNYASEQSTLYEAGLLTASEAAELMARWKHEFDRACAPGFSVCLGPQRFLTGEDARRAHFAWADIPATLIEAWTIERQRQSKKEKPRSTTTAGLDTV